MMKNNKRRRHPTQNRLNPEIPLSTIFLGGGDSLKVMAGGLKQGFGFSVIFCMLRRLSHVWSMSSET